MGLEPTTATLATWRSTTELHPRYTAIVKGAFVNARAGRPSLTLRALLHFPHAAKPCLRRAADPHRDQHAQLLRPANPPRRAGKNAERGDGLGAVRQRPRLAGDGVYPALCGGWHTARSNGGRVVAEAAAGGRRGPV